MNIQNDKITIDAALTSKELLELVRSMTADMRNAGLPNTALNAIINPSCELVLRADGEYMVEPSCVYRQIAGSIEGQVEEYARDLLDRLHFKLVNLTRYPLIAFQGYFYRCTPSTGPVILPDGTEVMLLDTDDGGMTNIITTGNVFPVATPA